MSKRRPMGALEDRVMEYLWLVDAPVTPSMVHKAVAPELAYTTITTILTRLWDKGRVERARRGRAFEYSPVRSEADYRAEAMRVSLGDATDRGAVLSSFVDALDSSDLEFLRTLIGEEGD